MSNTGEPPHQEKEPPEGTSGREAYNIVSDTVTGVNFRLKDNVVQVIVTGVCIILGAIIGAFVVSERVAGALVGGFLGLVTGCFGSGIFLMVFRAVRHIRGRHD